MTKLAIIECVVAVALYVGIGVYFHTFRHFVIAVAVAPLMLFRTEASVNWGLNKYIYCHFIYAYAISYTTSYLNTRYWWAIMMLFGWLLFALLNLAVLVLLCAGTCIRIVATVYWLLRRPLYTLSAMPRNWERQCLFTDIFYPPEIVPFESAHKGLMTFSHTLEALKDWKWVKHEAAREDAFLTIFEFLSNVYGQLFHIGLLIISIVGWLPPLLYRISFKATSLVYSPFVWVVQRTLRSAPSVKLRLERITKGELEKTGRVLSTFALAILAAKIGVAFGGADVSPLIAKLPTELMGLLIVPNTWPWWLFVLWTGALLSFFLFYYSDAALRRLDATYKDRWLEKDVEMVISTATFLRASLAVVVMAYFFQWALMTVV